MIAATHKRATVLVTDSHRGSAINIIRSLGRAGRRVIAADCDARSAGFRCKHTDGCVTYPAPSESPAAFVDAIERAVRDHSVDLIIPVTDEAILPLSQSRERFAGLCKIAMPDTYTLAIVTDKRRTVELAESLGVPTPRTGVVETVAEARALAESMCWPVVLKPQASRVYRDGAAVEHYTVSYAGDMADLERQMGRLEGLCPVLLQEYLTGEGHGVEILAHEGRVLAAFQHRRLREIPLNGGASALRESVALDPAMYEYSRKLLEALRWTGLAMVEFKVGPNGASLMEINGRVWGSLPLAVLSGMDFPARLAAMTLDGPPAEGTPNTDYRVGVRARNLELDMLWVAAVLLQERRYRYLPIPSRSEAFGALLGLANPGIKYDIMSLKDPGPGFAEIRAIVRKFWRKFGSRVRSKGERE